MRVLKFGENNKVDDFFFQHEYEYFFGMSNIASNFSLSKLAVKICLQYYYILSYLRAHAFNNRNINQD